MTRSSLKDSKKIIHAILANLQQHKKKFSHDPQIEFTLIQARKNAKVLLTTLDLLEERIEEAQSHATLTPLEKPLLGLIAQHINQAFTHLARIEREENETAINEIVTSLQTIFTSHYLDEAIHYAEDATIEDERPTARHTYRFATFITSFGTILFVLGALSLAIGFSLAPAAACMVLGILMAMLGITISKENAWNSRTLQLKSHVLLEKPYLIMAGELGLLVNSLATLRKYELKHKQ